MSNDIGKVIWITGYSSSGKTTIGREVKSLLDVSGVNSVFLDGDDLRAMLNNKYGYTRNERIELAMFYFKLCSNLSTQGITVIISAIAMYDEVRVWLQKFIPNLIEIYLEVPEEVRLSRDKKTKKIYKDFLTIRPFYDEPKNASLLVRNYGEMTPNNAANKIIEFIYGVDYEFKIAGRQTHWDSYYRTPGALVNASSFAIMAESAIPKNSKILEVGCGNGRDSAYFIKNEHSVTGIDTSLEAINQCNDNFATFKDFFYCGSIEMLTDKLGRKNFDVIYSRFSLHAMTEDEEFAFLDHAQYLLRSYGLLLIECRSINDPLSHKGEVLSPTERIHGHYRRFIILNELKNKLETRGFHLESYGEYSGVTIVENDDPVVIRVVARLSK